MDWASDPTRLDRIGAINLPISLIPSGASLSAVSMDVETEFLAFCFAVVIWLLEFFDDLLPKGRIDLILLAAFSKMLSLSLLLLEFELDPYSLVAIVAVAVTVIEGRGPRWWYGEVAMPRLAIVLLLLLLILLIILVVVVDGITENAEAQVAMVATRWRGCLNLILEEVVVSSEECLLRLWMLLNNAVVYISLLWFIFATTWNWHHEAGGSHFACCLLLALAWLTVHQARLKTKRERGGEGVRKFQNRIWNSMEFYKLLPLFSVVTTTTSQHHNITIINRSYSTLFIRYTLLQWSIYNKTSSSAASEYLPLQRKVKYCLPLYTRKLVKHCLPATGADEETSKVKTTRKLL